MKPQEFVSSGTEIHHDTLVTPMAQRSQQLTWHRWEKCPPKSSTEKGIKHNRGPNSVLTDMRNEEEIRKFWDEKLSPDIWVLFSTFFKSRSVTDFCKGGLRGRC